ncbi:hypothetical protein [Flavivirga spongiicola]|uniref:Redoxin domain-containing protein n=1 Tax=Flavivirga spongiicola TaxID=421621 RepID=A0ABU7XMC7_9FLAO|nr:hypothetical protein [Flavivirga sp. MEBiC05379]MDO5981578.1 hypothetical protein [Flavivirga sp. MEBiC05379]
MKKMIYISSYILLSLCLISCQSKQKKKNISKHESIINTALGTRLKLPIDLSTYDYLNNYKSDSISTLNSKFKIYSRIDGSCGTCIDFINKWSDLSYKLNEYDTSIILMCHSEDNFELIKYLGESGKIKKFQYPLFFDKKNEFIKLNSFMKEHKHFETVLTDKDNYILAVGNPIISKDIGDLYIKEINKSSSDKK